PFAAEAERSELYCVRKFDKIERARISGLRRVYEIKRDDRDQHQKAAESGKDKEFHRRVNAVRSAPDADEKEHRDERSFEKQIEHEQVERNKNAEHRALQKQHERKERGFSFFDRIPG